MKKVNFIHPIPPQEQRAIARWARISTALFFCTLACITVAQLEQCWRLQTTRTALNKLDSTPDHESSLMAKNKFKTERELLQAQATKLSYRLHHRKNPYPYLTDIMTALAESTSIESVAAKKNDVEIVVKTMHVDAATHCVQALSASSHLHNLKLVSLQPREGDSGQLLCTIRGGARY